MKTPQTLRQIDGLWQISVCSDEDMAAVNHGLILAREREQLTYHEFDLWGHVDKHFDLSIYQLLLGGAGVCVWNMSSIKNSSAAVHIVRRIQFYSPGINTN